jgi:DHA1 family inner membrane transport protein
MVTAGRETIMEREASARSWLVPVAAILVAVFAVCTSELVIAGLLPAIAIDLAVDIPTAGLLISGYALGVAVAGPLLALATASIPRKMLLLAVMAVFVAGNVLCALSTGYAMLLAARLVLAACHGLFFGVTMVIAMNLAPPGRQATAISVVTAGVSMATVIGVPLGTAIGNAYGWRMPFWIITAAVFAATLLLVLLIPATPAEKRSSSNFTAELRAAFRPVVVISFATIILALIGIFALLAYLVPLLTDVSGVPLSVVPWVLFAIGVTGFFGNLLGGRLGDWNPTLTVTGVFATNMVLFLVLWQVADNSTLVPVLLCAIWLVGFMFLAPIQARVLKEVSDAPNFASTLMSSAFQVGIAVGAGLGGAVISAGWGYRQLPFVSAVFLGFSLLATLGLIAYDRRRKLAPA